MHLCQKPMTTISPARRIQWLMASLSLLFSIHTHLPAQQTEVYTEAKRALNEGHTYSASGLHAQAFDAYTRSVFLVKPAQSPDFDALQRDALLGQAKSALMAEKPEGEQLMRTFIREYGQDPVVTEATIFFADTYFNAGDHKTAISHYATLKTRDLNAEQLSEVRFKQGYGHFVQKQFSEAETILGEVTELKTKYYYPVNYYYGMCKFFRDDYDAALRSFERVAQSERYKDYVPYYITQIYFARGEYVRAIAYAEPKLSQAGLKNKDDIGLLIGRAYFETGNYAAALPHLESYEKHTGQMRAEDFYQLAFSQYQAGRYKPAISNFQHVATQKSIMGQRANFYIADCYLRSGDMQSARTAFRNVSRMSYDDALRTEALLEYGKISAQLRYDSEAIQALDAVPTSSSHHKEAQETLRDIFHRTRDYATALSALESLQQLSPALREAYQHVSLNRGIQLMNDGRTTEADDAFAKVQKYPVDAALSAQGYFWRAEVAHRRGDYDKSLDFLKQYFTLVKSNNPQLPLQSSVPLAHYMQGYNTLRQNNYATAQAHFVDAVAGLRNHSSAYTGSAYRYILPDAMVRAGDCAFKRNRYPDARRQYEDALQIQGPHVVYARFQRAMIEGLERKPAEKVRQLEDVVRLYPESDLADDALLQLGMTYQEMGTPEQAIVPLLRLVDQYPHSELFNAALLRVGLIYFNKGDLQNAITYYKRVFRHQPNALEAREAMSALEEIYVQDLRTPDAYFDFVATVPGYEISALKRDSLSYRVAELQYERGEYASAINAFSDYLQKFPKGINAIPAHFYRGDSHAILKQYSEALRDFETVAATKSGALYPDALRRTALLHYNHSQNFLAAFNAYSGLHEVTTDPSKRFEVEMGILRSAYRAGKLPETLKWADAVAGNTLATEASRAEAQYYAGHAAMDRKEMDAATERFRRVIALTNNEYAAEARFRLAEIAYAAFDHDLAEQRCHDANAHNANYPYWIAKSLILLSDIAVDKGDLFNAKAPLEAVIENFKGDATITAEAQKKLDRILAMEKQQSRIKREDGTSLDLQIEDRDR